MLCSVGFDAAAQTHDTDRTIVNDQARGELGTADVVRKELVGIREALRATGMRIDITNERFAVGAADRQAALEHHEAARAACQVSIYDPELKSTRRYPPASFNLTSAPVEDSTTFMSEWITEVEGRRTSVRWTPGDGDDSMLLQYVDKGRLFQKVTRGGLLERTNVVTAAELKTTVEGVVGKFVEQATAVLERSAAEGVQFETDWGWTFVDSHTGKQSFGGGVIQCAPGDYFSSPGDAQLHAILEPSGDLYSLELEWRNCLGQLHYSSTLTLSRAGGGQYSIRNMDYLPGPGVATYRQTANVRRGEPDFGIIEGDLSSAVNSTASVVHDASWGPRVVLRRNDSIPLPEQSWSAAIDLCMLSESAAAAPELRFTRSSPQSISGNSTNEWFSLVTEGPAQSLGELGSTTWELRNESGEPLILQEVDLGCSVFGIEYQSGLIMPNGKAVIKTTTFAFDAPSQEVPFIVRARSIEGMPVWQWLSPEISVKGHYYAKPAAIALTPSRVSSILGSDAVGRDGLSLTVVSALGADSAAVDAISIAGKPLPDEVWTATREGGDQVVSILREALAITIEDHLPAQGVKVLSMQVQLQSGAGLSIPLAIMAPEVSGSGGLVPFVAVPVEGEELSVQLLGGELEDVRIQPFGRNTADIAPFEWSAGDFDSEMGMVTLSWEGDGGLFRSAIKGSPSGGIISFHHADGAVSHCLAMQPGM